MVLGVLNEGKDVSSLNSTHIVLIYKVSNLIKMIGFRPISFCNVIYKLISKIIGNCMKPFLSIVIHESQSTFYLID